MQVITHIIIWQDLQFGYHTRSSVVKKVKFLIFHGEFMTAKKLMSLTIHKYIYEHFILLHVFI